jgi:hypothetical protein
VLPVRYELNLCYVEESRPTFGPVVRVPGRVAREARLFGEV